MSGAGTVEQFVEDQLRTGIFSSYDEMVAEGLRLLQEKTLNDEALADEFRGAIKRADGGHAGTNVSLEAVKQLSERYLAEESTSG